MLFITAFGLQLVLKLHSKIPLSKAAIIFHNLLYTLITLHTHTHIQPQ